VGRDGTRTLDFAILENGRGPAGHAVLRYDDGGALVSYTADGHDEFGKPAPERFAREGRRLSWENLADKGARDLGGPAVYVTATDDFETFAGLVRAAVRAGGKLPVLPDGEATVERIGERTVGKVRLTGYAVLGLELAPLFAWLDEHGELFARTGQGEGWIRAGFEDTLPELVLAQRHELERRYHELAARLAQRPPAAGVAFIHARVLAPSGDRWLAAHTLVVAGDRIAAIGPSAPLAPPAGAAVVDVAGRAILPGLWDSHQHFQPGTGILDIASGVTTGRDMGNEPDELDAL